MGRILFYIATSGIFLGLSMTPGDLQAQNPYTSSYQYLTQHETTFWGERIKFWHMDTLRGPVHSNDTIAIMENPVFYDSVSTSAPVFWQGPGYNPYFVNYDPVFNAPRVALPDSATEIRQLAAAAGTYFSSAGGLYAHRLYFLNVQGWVLYQWQMGLPFDTTYATIVSSGPPSDSLTIFVDGYLELMGTIRGRITVGARGHPIPGSAWFGYHCIRLLDDVRYWFADPRTGAFNDTTAGYTDMLGIVSESNICIADTWANGRENGAFRTNYDPDSSSIIITAALAALGNPNVDPQNGSFSFEDQNDDPATCPPWEFYTGEYNCPLPQDERGDIHLWGSVTQHRRGYVHRSNQGGTGYGKDYHFDQRFRADSPFRILARHIPVFDPPVLDFGEVLIDTTETLSVILRNEGGTYIDIESAYTNSPTFTVPPVDSTTLNPGDSAQFQVSFTPSALVEYRDTLTVELYYGNDLIVPLTGVGSNLGIEIGDALPEEYQFSAFPNPFNHQLLITWDNRDPQASLSIYDIFGRRVEAIPPDAEPSGKNFYIWQPADLAAGVYVLALSLREKRLSKKVVYLK